MLLSSKPCNLVIKHHDLFLPRQIPVVHLSAFIHPQATVIGHVTVGPDCYIGPGAVLRGDWGKIVLEKGCNVQGLRVAHV